MDADASHDTAPEPSGLSPAVANAAIYMALGGAMLLLAKTSRRHRLAAGLVLSAAPLLYRGLAGSWPETKASHTKRALSGARGIHLRESVRLARPIADVYRYWRRLENLPRFMAHVDRVTMTSGTESHWVTRGPAGVSVEWDADVINDIENRLIAWRSLPGSDVVSAGSVHFDEVREGRATEVRVHLQYAPPAGRAGVLLASLFGHSPAFALREDLRRLKHLLEAGEIPRATATS